MNITETLKSLADEEYRQFQIKLMPTVAPQTVLGVRTPLARKLAKEIYSSGEFDEFISALPHKYYDEYNLHGFILCLIPDFDRCVRLIDEFLPYVDNWATCDLVSPKCFKKNKDKLLKHIDVWLASDKTYTVRFGIEMLMSHYLDDSFDESFLFKVAKIDNDDYYVKMMQAWYFATALAKQYESVLPFLEEKRLQAWVHNKTISKACESYRITNEQKEYLKKLKIKK